MVGKNHILANVSTVAGLYGSLHLVCRALPTEASALLGKLEQTLVPAAPSRVLNFILAAGLLFIGSLLPDIDNQNSILGRFLHLPVRHRGITHTLWALLILALPVLAFKSFFWLWFGYFLHIFYDSLSAGGICWCYPFTKYITYSSGAFIRPRHKLKAYHTGQESEKVFTAIIMILGLGLWMASIVILKELSFVPVMIL